MITLLRKARKSLINSGSTRRYLLYAVGEVLLVMIGILLALQVNNWNEARKERKAQLILLDGLLEDLDVDMRGFQYTYNRLDNMTTLHEQLYKVGVLGEEDVQLQNLELIRAGVIYNPVSRENDPNVPHKIDDLEIRKQLLWYFKKIKFTQTDADIFVDFTDKEMRAYLRQKGIHNIESRFRDQMVHGSTSINRPRLIELTKDPFFQQLIYESNLKSNAIKMSLEELMDKNEELSNSIRAVLNGKF